MGKKICLRSGGVVWGCFLLAVLLLLGCSEEAPRERVIADPRGAPPGGSRPAVDPYQQIEGLPGPTPEREAEQVVHIVIEAMGRNDDPEPDAGIKTAYNFASPQNKRMTGPLDRFIEMVKVPLYRPMLNFEAAEYSPIEMRDNRARQAVELTDAEGEKTVYLIGLSRQTNGPFEGCWMTDSVRPVPTDGSPSSDEPRADPAKGPI